MDKVLVPAPDHTYIEMWLSEQEVVYNNKTKEYSEYYPDYYEPNDGDTIVKRTIAS